MKLIARILFLLMIIGIQFNLRHSQLVFASSCNTTEDNLFADSCINAKNVCTGNAGATKTTCYANCDSEYGVGTPDDIACKSSCDSAYNSTVSGCNSDYNNCLSLRLQSCQTQCTSFCGGTTGATCCQYDDTAKGCSFTCGCHLPPPQCPSPVCNGSQWTCFSPILLDIRGDGFRLTSVANGVWFDLAADGLIHKWSWTAPDTDDGFLALDRNDNGIIDDGRELFGSATPQPPSDSPNGFLALAVFDKPENGGNDDGFIDSSDAIYSHLRVWVDTSHDGLTRPHELHTLSELGIARIDLQYEVKPRTDEFGNEFYLRARVWDRYGRRGGRWAWDVYLRQ